MQAASVQKPSALSFQLLPSADVWLTRHWSEFLLLTCRDTSVHAKCEKNAAWRVTHTSVLHFLSHWRVVHTSLKRISSTDVSTTRQCMRISQKSRFFRTTDVWMTCQRNHRVTVLAPVWLNSLRIKKFAWKLKPNVSWIVNNTSVKFGKTS